MNPKNENLVFAKHLRAYMEARDLSINALARKIEVSPSLICEYVNGVKMPRIKMVDRLCAFFGGRRSDLLDPTEELTQDESELIQDYKLLIPEEKRIAKNLISDMAQKYKEKNAVGSAS